MSEGLSFNDALGNRYDFETLDEAESFLKKEKAYWDDKLVPFEKKRPFMMAYPDHLGTLIKAIENEKSGEGNPNDFVNIKTNFINWAHSNWVVSTDPVSETLISAYLRSGAAGDAFWKAIRDKQVQLQNTNVDTFIGTMMAYEHLRTDVDRTSLLHAESKAFSTLRTQLEAEKLELLSDIARVRQESHDLLGEIKDTWSETHEDARAQSSQTIKDHSDLFNKMAETSRDRFMELESLYQEKLRLKAPADYWNERARELGFQGGLWALLLLISVVSMAVASGLFFWSWLHKPAIEFGLASLQGVALFGTTVAAGAYLLRTLSRLTFSAFHLKRDAEEREQLAHLYLALINEGAVEASSRDIVLQALFSRSESGLLLGDSAPTMPNAADIVAGLSKMKSQ